MKNGDKILVATRKGLFEFTRRVAGDWASGPIDFIGDPVSMVLRDPRDGTTHAALNLGHFGVKMKRQRQGQKTWEECAAPAYPEAPDVENAPSLEQIWELVPGGADEPGVLWAGTIPGGLFRSTDGGNSWELNQALWDRPERSKWFGGGYDKPGIHSVCVDPRNSRHITVGVSIGGAWQSVDGGASWALGGKGMNAGYVPSGNADDPNMQDVHRLVQCPAAADTLWVQHHCGMYRSTDGIASWQEITTARPSNFGFAVVVHPRDPNTAWFVPAIKDNCRIPVDGKFVVTRTRDGGSSFDILNSGLPTGQSYDLVYRHGLAIDDSGERLVMGSTTGGLWVSENGGDAWHCISVHLPPVYCVQFV